MTAMKAPFETPCGAHQLQFLDLPPTDIIIFKIIPFLSPSDWLNLRATNRQLYFLVNEYFRSMKYLDLSSSQHFPKALLEMIFQQCQQLKVLKLTNSKWFDDNSIKEVFQNNTNLRYIDLSNCQNLKNGSLQPLAVNCQKLNTIILQNCNWLTVGAIEILAFHYRDTIIKADFSGCFSLSEASIVLFIKRQSNLQSLSLGNLLCVRDETLSAISQSCPRLVYLDVTRCPRVTDNGIQLIGEYCQKLLTLKVEGCRLVTERSLSKMRLRHIQIDNLQYPVYLLHRRNQIQSWPKTQL